MAGHHPLLQVGVTDIRMHGRDDEHPPLPRGPQGRARLQFPVARLERQLDRGRLLDVGHGDVGSHCGRNAVPASPRRSGCRPSKPIDAGSRASARFSTQTSHLALRAVPGTLEPRQRLGLEVQQFSRRRRAALQPHIVIERPTALIVLQRDRVLARLQERRRENLLQRIVLAHLGIAEGLIAVTRRQLALQFGAVDADGECRAARRLAYPRSRAPAGNSRRRLQAGRT